MYAKRCTPKACCHFRDLYGRDHRHMSKIGKLYTKLLILYPSKYVEKSNLLDILKKKNCKLIPRLPLHHTHVYYFMLYHIDVITLCGFNIVDLDRN